MGKLASSLAITAGLLALFVSLPVIPAIEQRLSSGNELSRGVLLVSQDARRALTRPLRVNINVSGLLHLEPAEFLNQLGVGSEEPVWNPAVFELRERSLRVPLVDSAEVDCQAFLPACTLHVREAQPWLVAEYANDAWLLLSTGKILGALRNLTHPRLVLAAGSVPRIGGLDQSETLESALTSDHNRLLFAVEQIRYIEDAGGLPFAVERYDLLADGGLQIVPLDPRTKPQVKVELRSPHAARDTLNRLQAVLSDLQARNEVPSQLDLRFSNQVVVH